MDAPSGPAVVTIGVFDGVHRGHQALLDSVARQAREMGCPALAITFDPHPMSVIAPDRAPLMLTDISRRVELLHQHGADEVRVLDFTPEMSAWSPREFVERVIIDQCHTRHLMVGENFRFGAKAAGDVRTLAQMGQEAGFAVEAHVLDGDAEPFSSTRTRAALAAGDVAEAARILGRSSEVTGIVSRGEQRGRLLGFPTANVPVPSGRAVPADGVYACRVEVAGEVHPAATSVGTNPTFEGERESRVESYILDRDDLDLYDAEMTVAFIARIRGMETFQDVEALVAQMDRDVDEARRILDVDS